MELGEVVKVALCHVLEHVLEQDREDMSSDEASVGLVVHDILVPVPVDSVVDWRSWNGLGAGLDSSVFLVASAVGHPKWVAGNPSWAHRTLGLPWKQPTCEHTICPGMTAMAVCMFRSSWHSSS